MIKASDTKTSESIESILADYNVHMACSFSRLEYKRVVIGNLAYILKCLVEEESFFAALNRTQKITNQRRPSTLVSIMAWIGLEINRSMDCLIGNDLDQTLRIRAEAYIRRSVMFAWHRFNKSVTSVTDQTECARAREAPKVDREKGTVENAIREGRCKNRECKNVSFFNSKMPNIREICSALDNLERQGVRLTKELTNARSEARAAMAGQTTIDRLYDYNNCLKLADVWIHLECLSSGVRDFFTTNHKESEHLCPSLKLTQISPSSPREEKGG